MVAKRPASIAKSRVHPSIFSLVRIDQRCFGRNGGSRAPIRRLASTFMMPSFSHSPAIRWPRRMSGYEAMIEEVRFAEDSPLEGYGFEPSVPVAREPVYIAESELRGDRRAAKKIPDYA
jgi:hypothetical protein